MKNIIRKIFNSNTGYFINEHLYFYNGKPYAGYVLCKGYIAFGIPGYDRIGFCLDKAEAEKAKSELEIK